MAAPINVRWNWQESAGGKHYIYAEGSTNPLLVLNMSGTERAATYTRADIETVLKHIVTAHNSYLDNEAAWNGLKLK